MGLEQGVQPGRAGTFFESHMQAAAQTANKLQNGLHLFVPDFHSSILA
jgi:hypothetical protein